MGTTVDEKKHYDDHDIATFIARKEFEKRHPEEEQPEWLKKYMLTTGRKTGSKKWTMRKISTCAVRFYNYTTKLGAQIQ